MRRTWIHDCLRPLALDIPTVSLPTPVSVDVTVAVAWVHVYRLNVAIENVMRYLDALQQILHLDLDIIEN